MLHNRFAVAKALSEMGTDIHWTCKASMFNGNALNVAHSPQEADWLLESLRALRHIDDESLDARKKELRKILNARKKELSLNP